MSWLRRPGTEFIYTRKAAAQSISTGGAVNGIYLDTVVLRRGSFFELVPGNGGAVAGAIIPREACIIAITAQLNFDGAAAPTGLRSIHILRGGATIAHQDVGATPGAGIGTTLVLLTEDTCGANQPIVLGAAHTQGAALNVLAGAYTPRLTARLVDY